MSRLKFWLIPAMLLAGCGGGTPLLTQPQLTPSLLSDEHTAMMSSGLPLSLDGARPYSAGASLWSGTRNSLLGDRRAMQRGDILTVAISINDRAEFSNTSAQARSSSQEMSVGALLGLPERAAEVLYGGATLNPGVQTESSSNFNGNGSVSRNERLTLRVAATVIATLPNGALEITGSQEIRVNNEIRELTVTGFVRPADINRQNEVSYDRIASARISYGGRGPISVAQSPRYGHQIVDRLSPF
ncbi:flagellar L-ring protein FlgH [Ketogulonicigenium robustum]|uniref:Flagellar L-ring protein n=1 Tax=Ketogulonicigenium robustum TaxID=92947 RepID=A0A1W6P1Y4_9RHOB|nr:flagellar basal body L-ring protein FlgH [Ketogulonicigenium robustum]ARO15411.1 flagellar L-ring protein FlgH [Ketogulonicigenium robustum]